MPMNTQARLLRVLEYGEFIKVGSSKVLKTDVRVVAATNVNLLGKIEQKKFREDLYYRLGNGADLHPPLRERATTSSCVQEVRVRLRRRSIAQNQSHSPMKRRKYC